MKTDTYLMPSNETAAVLDAINVIVEQIKPVAKINYNPYLIATMAVEKAFGMRPSAAEKLIGDLSAAQWDVFVTRAQRVAYKVTGLCICGTFKDTGGKTHDVTCTNDDACRFPTCYETSYELALCRDHFGEHVEWKRREGYGAEHRVEQWIAVEHPIDYLLGRD